MLDRPFQAGECVIYRETDGRQVIDFKPVTVVDDSAELVALWLPLGTRTKRPD